LHPLGCVVEQDLGLVSFPLLRELVQVDSFLSELSSLLEELMLSSRQQQGASGEG
jgi:hypothetical protein